MDTAKPTKEERSSMEPGQKQEGEPGRMEPSVTLPENLEDLSSPFRLPSDEEVFVTREAEKRKLQEMKEKQQHLKIWEKKTATTHGALKRPKDTDIPPADIKEEPGEKKTHGKKKLIQAALDIVKGRVRGGNGKELGEKKQGMQEFVDQKKEMFLVVKTTGILNNEKANLEKMAKERENALELADKQMKKNKEEFLNKKQDQANETKRMQENLEVAVRRKQEKEEQLAQLEQDEANTRQRNKNNMEREDNLWVYKQFHDKVANKEWLLQQPLEIKKRKWIEKKVLAEMPEKDRPKDPSGLEISEEKRARLEEEFIKLVKENAIPIENPEQAFPLYFEKPEQLMEMFTLLEEQNLMLIQKNQGLLNEIEEKKATFKGTKARFDKRYSNLFENEQKLLEKTKEEEKRGGEQTAIQESKEDEEIAKLFSDFKSMISPVYMESIKQVQVDNPKKTKQRAVDVPTEKLIEHLTEIEAKINDIHMKIGDNPSQTITKLQEIQKRDILDEKNKLKNAEKTKNDEKIKQANARRDQERALKKYVGKPIMQKMLETKKAKKESKKLEMNNEEQEFVKYFEI